MENFIQNKFGYCFYETKKTALIYNLYVHPEHRRKGMAKILLQHVVNEIRCMGYFGEIGIQVEPREDIKKENIKKFYERMGLKPLM